MKKKLLFTLFLVTLLFVTGCNKEEQTSVPTPTTAPPTETVTPTPSPTPSPTPTSTPTPTPTPLPENLAMTALKKISASLDSFQSFFPEDIADYSKGAGYDVTLEFTIGNKFAEKLGIPQFDTLRLNGTIDIKDTLAAKGTLYLKDTELAIGELFTDYQTVFYNLPEYSNQYATCPFEEIIDLPAQELTEYTKVAFGNDKLDFLLTNIKLLLDCFQPQDGIETGCTIGSGSYIVTGDKYTVRASSEDIKPVLATLVNDERTLDALLDILTDFYEMDFSYLQLEYYAGETDSFAWALTPDFAPELPLVFVSTPTGFRLFSVTGEEENMFLYSETTGLLENKYTIYLGADDEAEDIIKYKFEKNSFFIEFESDDIFASLDYSVKDGTYDIDATIAGAGTSILTKVEGTQEWGTVSMTFAYLGAKMFDFSIDMKMREYCETTAPAEAVDMDTWTSRFNYNALMTDMDLLMEDFPYLNDLFDYKEDTEFSDMTGYAVDETGSVDFEPLESEVLAKGQPSTGFFHLEIPEVTKTNLLNYAAEYFDNTYEERYPYYNINGSLDEGIYSYYCQFYDYYDNNNFDNSINIAFDAISGDLIWVCCYHDSAGEAIKMSNDVLDILGVDYTVTEENIGYYDIYDNYYINAVDDEEYYKISIHPCFE